MELSPEDALRINVLLASPIEAVRIDESSMTVHALSGKGEARVKLNPNCRDESYLRMVREALSSHVLGSPGGYPVYLKRWTRMGHARDEILESLLLLGEPEAVAAVGDDVADLPMFNAVGLAVAVANAHPQVQAAAHWITAAAGGQGAVREVCDLLVGARAAHIG